MARGADDGSVPARVDMSKPSLSRVYDAMLGGKDNFQVDRDVRARLLALDPEFSRATWDRRDFVMRVTRYLTVEMGVTQFLDCGATLPEAENPHEVAQRLNRESTMVYVSRDPAVLAHGRALLADNDRTHVVEADFRHPRQVLDHPTVTKYLDFDQPVAILHAGTIHHVRDERDPEGILSAYVSALAAGSYVAFAHFIDPGPDSELAELTAELIAIYQESGIGVWPRGRDRLLAMLSGLQLLEPGLVPLVEWWPDGPRLRPLGRTQRLAFGAVGRKR
ncbi:MAG: SAM-dependent methyltransferase [Kibdelosporangium sp.]